MITSDEHASIKKHIPGAWIFLFCALGFLAGFLLSLIMAAHSVCFFMEGIQRVCRSEALFSRSDTIAAAAGASRTAPCSQISISGRQWSAFRFGPIRAALPSTFQN